MQNINKCLNEWNAIVEALGCGKQTILIRKYKTNNSKFLLCPTGNYASKKDYLKSFQEQFQPFVKNNHIPNIENNRTEIKYYAKIENILEKSSKEAAKFEKFSIWNKKHIESYLKNQNGYIWILRVYKLKNSYKIEKSPGKIFFYLNRCLSIEGIKPVINDKQFNGIVEKLKKS